MPIFYNPPLLFSLSLSPIPIPQSLCSSAVLPVAASLGQSSRRVSSPLCRTSPAAMHASTSIGTPSSRPGLQERSDYKLLPMKCGSHTGLPPVPCPKCGEEILELVAALGSKVPGAIFFKCRLHERDDPSTCPWFLFAEKYEKMLIAKGMIGATRVETEPLVPELSSEVACLEGAADGRDNTVAILNQIGGLDAKLNKLVIPGQIGVVCTLVIAVFVVVGVIILLVNRH